MGDHPDADAQEMEDRAHPLGIAAGEVVVHGDDVYAAPRKRVEDGGHRRDQGLAFARSHLGDLALMQDGSAHQLDIEMAHPECPLHRLAGHRESFRKDIVEGLLEAFVLAPAALLLQLAAALQIRVVKLILGRLVGLGGRVDVPPEFRELGTDLVIGEGFVRGFECVGFVHHGLEAPHFAVVRVDKTVQESHSPCSIGEVAPESG